MKFTAELISQEVLKYLGIKYVYFTSTGGITNLIQPVHLEIDNWVCSSSGQLSDQGILRIILENETVSAEVRTENCPEGMQLPNCHTVIFKQPLPNNLVKSIIEYKKLVRTMDKRSEERYKIGQENWRNFGLSHPDCSILIRGKRIRCVITNASVHGALLTGQRSLAIHTGDKIMFSADFSANNANKISKIIQNGIVVNTQPAFSDYWQYSIHFIEPVSLLWLQHIKMLLA